MTVIVIFFLRVGEVVRCRRSCSRCHTFQHSAPRRVHQKLLPPLLEDSTRCAYGWSAARCCLLVPTTIGTASYDLNAIPRSALLLQSLCHIAVFGRFCRARLQAGTVDSSTCSPKGERYSGRRQVGTPTLQASFLMLAAGAMEAANVPASTTPGARKIPFAVPPPAN